MEEKKLPDRVPKGSPEGGQFTSGESDYSSEVNGRIQFARSHGIELPLNADGSVNDIALQKLHKEWTNEKTTIKQQVQANAESILKTNIIADVSKEDMITDRQKAIAVLRERLSKNNGIVERKEFGKVQVGNKIKKSAAYIKNIAEIVAIAAVPSIIMRGIEISRHDNHKGRGYPSVTFAGRVRICGKEGIMAVTVVKTVENRYKMHRVFTPDGNVFEI